MRPWSPENPSSLNLHCFYYLYVAGAYQLQHHLHLWQCELHWQCLAIAVQEPPKHCKFCNQILHKYFLKTSLKIQYFEALPLEESSYPI